MNTITSSQNPVIKEIKALKERKHREATGLFFIEGIKFVEEALKEKTGIVRVVISEQLPLNKGGEEILSKVKACGCEMFSVPEGLFKEISDTQTPQGILAVISARHCSLEEIIEDNNFLVLLDSIQDPGNMGTIIRTADATGATGILVSKGCVDVYNPKVLRSTMGSIFHVPICMCENTVETVNMLKSQGVKVYAAHLNGKLNYFEPDMKNNITLIVGNEANGISDEVAASANELVKIPMPGRSESLNASIAAGLLMYEVVRQRMKDS